MADYRVCPHCRGTGMCKSCRGSGRLELQKGRVCTSCYPQGSGKCANCRGFGGFDASGRPASRPGTASTEGEGGGEAGDAEGGGAGS